LVLEDIQGDRAQIQSSKNALEVATVTQEEVTTVLQHFLDSTVRRILVSFYAPGCRVVKELIQLLAGDLVVVTNIEPV
jgi:thioredoxin-like negative regulator of GroEL